MTRRLPNIEPLGDPGNSGLKKSEEDDDYRPTPATVRSEGDESPPEDPDWESGSLAWGLAIFGGLATACAGVFGGECVSR